MSEMSIGEVARRTGVPASALRYYEQAGVLPAPRRVGGRRRYAPDALRRVELLRYARRAGFTLAEVRALLHDPGAGAPLGARWAALAGGKLRELDALVERAARMRRDLEAGLACRCTGIGDCAIGLPGGPSCDTP